MNRIRPLRREDLREVASLFEFVFGTGSRTAPSGLVTRFESLLLDHPWADLEIPSLVCLDDQDKLVGFLGSHVRRMRFDGQPIRLATSGQLVTEPRVRRQAAGAFLMQRYLAGPQDVTVTDTASETVRRIWEGFRGETAHLGRIGWIRLFRPWRFATEFLLRDRRPMKRAAQSLAGALDNVTVRVAPTHLDVRRPNTHGEKLTPRMLVENLSLVAGALRLHPDYDEDFLDWLFRELAQVRTWGSPLGFLVRDRSQKVLGWYVYHLKPGGISRVLQIAGKERDLDGVLDHLFHHARANGSAALQGRLEPSLVEGLSQRSCIFHASGHRVLVHSRSSEILHAVASGRALLTRMEGDWWMGPYLEPIS